MWRPEATPVGSNRGRGVRSYPTSSMIPSPGRRASFNPRRDGADTHRWERRGDIQRSSAYEPRHGPGAGCGPRARERGTGRTLRRTGRGRAGHRPTGLVRSRPTPPVRDVPSNRGAGGARYGVVLCPPVGDEDRRVYLTYPQAGGVTRRARDTPSSASPMTVRGDSAGTLDDPDRIESWTRSIAHAVEVVRAVGVPQVAVIGMRLGATLATRAAAAWTVHWTRSCSWDPCVTGREFLRHQQILLSTHSRPAGDRRRRCGHPGVPLLGRAGRGAPPADASLRSPLPRPARWSSPDPTGPPRTARSRPRIEHLRPAGRHGPGPAPRRAPAQRGDPLAVHPPDHHLAHRRGRRRPVRSAPGADRSDRRAPTWSAGRSASGPSGSARSGCSPSPPRPRAAGPARG